jgi:hypothetical protein
METKEFIKLAEEAGMNEKQILECIMHNEDSEKLGYSSLESDLELYRTSIISFH